MKETVNNFIADKFGASEVCPVGFDPLAQPKAFAQDLGNFVYQLHQLEATGAENPALMLSVIEAEFLTLLDQMKRIAPVEGLRLYWDKASKNPWTKPAVVLHGELNL
ncbi:protein kinase family protein, partial [Lactococcus garvieae]